jgi:pyruvate carboxylase
VNQLLGDIIKVTPSSKAVGDLALFLMQSHLSIDDLIKNGEKIDFPESVVSLMRGELGQPHGGLPSELQRVVLKGREPIQVRPGTLLPSADFVGERMRLKQQLGHEINRRDLLSALLYPGVFEEFDRHRARYGDVSAVPTPTFMYGLEPGEEILVEIGEGKVLHVKLVAIGEPGSDGYRPLLFELNGRSRVVRMLDDSIQSAGEKQPKADRDNPAELGAPLAGKVVGLLARVGDPVEQDQPLFLLEAMKLQVHIKAPQKGVLAELLVREGATVNAGDRLARLAPISS